MSAEQATDCIGVGVHRRIETGQPFVILTGRAMVEFDEGDALIFLRRGSTCTLPAMTSTRWTVSEPVEALFVTEASVVFRQHVDEHRPGDADVIEAYTGRPFRPRRHVS
ncbi:MAG: cupin domain-containing protein [Actinomycetales bacterium]